MCQLAEFFNFFQKCLTLGDTCAVYSVQHTSRDFMNTIIQLLPHNLDQLSLHQKIVWITFPVMSSGFRGLPAIVFGVITNDDQVKDDQATQVIGKAANFIGFGAKLAEEAFQQVG